MMNLSISLKNLLKSSQNKQNKQESVSINKYIVSKDLMKQKKKDKHITNKDHEHAMNVWHNFGMEYMEDYFNLYQKTDILLLADVAKEFRNFFL